MKIRKEKSLVCFARGHNDHRVQLTCGVRQRSIWHVPWLLHSKCHNTSNWQDIKAKLYICIFSLSLTDEGKNVFEVSHASNNILVAHNTNVDEHGKKTVLTGLFGMYDILLFTWTPSWNISFVCIFVHKIRICWLYPLLSLWDPLLFVQSVRDSGK